MEKILIIICLLLSFKLYSYDCGNEFHCDPNLKYPYYQCDNTGNAKVICSNSPLSLSPKPICLQINWGDAPNIIKLPTISGEEIVFDISKFANDIILAQNSMNCICGKQGDVIRLLWKNYLIL